MTFTSEKPLQTFIICNFYVIFCKFRIKNEILKLSKRGRGAEGGGGGGGDSGEKNQEWEGA